MDNTEDGDYRLCFDNSFSKLSEKMVFFVVAINSQSNTGGGRDEWADITVTESMVEYQLDDIRVRWKILFPSHQHLSNVMSSLCQPCLSSLSVALPPPGQNGLSVSAPGKEPSGPDSAADI